MPRKTSAAIIVRRAADGNWTWVYRGGIAALTALLAWIGVNISNKVDTLTVDFQKVTTDMNSLHADVGRVTGNLEMAGKRIDRQADGLNTMRDRLTVLETKFDDSQRARP